MSETVVLAITGAVGVAAGCVIGGARLWIFWMLRKAPDDERADV